MKPKVSKLSTTYIHHETEIKCEVDAKTGKLTIANGQKNRYNRFNEPTNSFVFIDSKPETVEKVAKALLAIAKAVKISERLK